MDKNETRKMVHFAPLPLLDTVRILYARACGNPLSESDAMQLLRDSGVVETILNDDEIIAPEGTILPSTIRPARLLPTDYEKWVGTGDGLPVLTLDQEEKALVMELSALPRISSYSHNIFCHESFSTLRESFYEPIISGDSSNPRFIILNDTPVLLHTIWHGGRGSGRFVTQT